MKQLLFIVFTGALVASNYGYAQQQNNNRQKYISLKADTITLDTVSVVYGTVKIILPDGTAADSNFYKINHAESKLIWNRTELNKKQIKGDSCKISFRALPVNFGKKYQRKNSDLINPEKKKITNPFIYTPDNKTNNDIFAFGGLNKNGNISRGIQFGNNQDLSVNSNLHLELSGKLNNDVDLLLSATDENIPIQPDGNTQQIQEFDRVFIQVSKLNTKLIAGDFVMKRPNSHFMNFYKRAQGLSFSTKFNLDSNPLPNKTAKLFLTASGAVSKGKFFRQIFMGIESNQGPYRLRGAENELFIIILSGTEKVYIDGELLQRGADNDYVIDYNTAEIIFTPKIQITKDKRITVEFQYSDKNYGRSLFHVGSEFTKGDFAFKVNYFNEQDNKNRPLQQQLSEEQKLLLSSVGDSLQNAIAPSADSAAYNNSEVFYQKLDSVIGSFTYNNVYVYSTDDSLANWRLGFSFVGNNKGNYVQINSSANGKVYQWIMPDTITGLPRGSFEPVILLISPKKKQLLTSSIEYKLGKTKNTKIFAEGAMSEYDINLYSRFNKLNDRGFAARGGFESTLPLWKTKSADGKGSATWLKFSSNYEYVQKTFTFIERYRSIEFDRDWNRPLTGTFNNNQHLISSTAEYRVNKNSVLGYNFSSFVEDDNYKGFKHGLFSNISNKKITFNATGSLLNSETQTVSTKFLRQISSFAYNLKYIKLGAKSQTEKNEFRTIASDSLTAASYQFYEAEAFISAPDTFKNKFTLSYKRREDKAVKQNYLNTTAIADNVMFDLQLLKNQKQRFRFTTTYRNLKIVDSTLILNKPDNSLVGRTEYDFILYKGLINSSTFYEIGSGLELKREFTFIEVPAGQGVYTWVDYNGNEVKELNEFEIAAFPDQATYIKVFVPTNDYVKTYTNQFSQTFLLKPAAIWNTKKGVRKFLSRFANQTAYRVDRKSTDENLTKSYNPFLKNVADSTLLALNSSVRNTLFFNQAGMIFGMDYTYSDNRNKTLLANGFDARGNTFNELKLRINLSSKWSVTSSVRSGLKSNTSQFFSTRNYKIAYSDAEPRISYQPNTSFRAAIILRYSEKKNSVELGGQKTTIQSAGAEIKYNILSKGSLLAKANYLKITYNDAENSPLAFEMLESLKPGNNFTWQLSYQRNLNNNMQLSFIYDGRKPEGIKVIHTGSAQVRAYF